MLGPFDRLSQTKQSVITNCDSLNRLQRFLIATSKKKTDVIGVTKGHKVSYIIFVHFHNKYDKRFQRQCLLALSRAQASVQFMVERRELRSA